MSNSDCIHRASRAGLRHLDEKRATIYFDIAAGWRAARPMNDAARQLSAAIRLQEAAAPHGEALQETFELSPRKIEGCSAEYVTENGAVLRWSGPGTPPPALTRVAVLTFRL